LQSSVKTPSKICCII